MMLKSSEYCFNKSYSKTLTVKVRQVCSSARQRFSLHMHVFIGKDFVKNSREAISSSLLVVLPFT